MRRFTLPLVLSTLIVAACSEGPTPPTGATPDDLSIQSVQGPGASKTKSVTVTPSSATIEQGQTVQLTATTKPPGGAVTWSSSNEAVAAVSPSGLVSGISGGSAIVTASAGVKSGSSSITVTSVPTGSMTFVGAGDIASCSSSGDEATANLLDGIAGTVFTLGDNAYESGSSTEYTNCYNPTWGRHKSRTWPSPGNHDYNTLGATGYYGYFGAAAGDPAKGYYSYDLGDWHIIVLNSSIAHDAASVQVSWLTSDLAATTKSCTLAYWHHPRFSSGSGHGNDPSVQPFWDALYAANADLILSGHDHDYERFAPQTPTGVADATRGIREFVVGTGGRSHYALGTLKVNSQVFDGATYGVLKLTLSASGYSWQFIPVAGATFTDSGTGSCH
jgi:hypothetical protein